MIKYGLMLMAVLQLCVGCHQGPAAERARKKVSDQRLSSYSPLRRLTYRDACGGEGALTVCVERISASEGATLVEVRIRNRSGFSYLLGGAGGKVVLANADGESVAGWGGAEKQLAPGENSVQFRMNGPFRGEPLMLTVEGIEQPPMLEPPYQTKKLSSVTVRLDG